MSSSRAIVFACMLLSACGHARPRDALILPKTAGLHLIAPFEGVVGVPGSRHKLAARLPGLEARLSGVVFETIAAGDAAVYARDLERNLALVARLNDRLALERAVIILLLPAELRAANPPEVLEVGVVLFGDDDETTATSRILRGVALTHHELPPPGTLIADLVRAGVASRFAISELDPERLTGNSPFVSHDPEQVAARLPHLVTLALHYPGEPRTSYGAGWITRDDLELLGWLATTELCRWRMWTKLHSQPAEAICHTDGEAAPTGLVEAAMAVVFKAARVDGAPTEPGPLADDLTLYLGGGWLSRRREVMLTHRHGVGLLRVKRDNLPGAARSIGRISPELMTRFAARLEALEVATMLDSYDAPVEDGSDYVFSLEAGDTSVDFAFYGPCGGTDPRHCELHGLITDLVDDVERGP